MSNIVVRGATALTLTCGALLVSGAVLAFTPAPARPACDPAVLARAGLLTQIPDEPALISRRGEVFRPAQCPAVKDATMAREGNRNLSSSGV